MTSLISLFIPVAEAITFPLRTPGERIVAITNSSPASAISDLYNFALGVGAMVAFGIIVYAAFRYTTTESSSVRHDSQGRIFQALLGLLLLLMVSVVLSLIDRNLPVLRNPDIQPLTAIQVAGGGATSLDDQDDSCWFFEDCSSDDDDPSGPSPSPNPTPGPGSPPGPLSSTKCSDNSECVQAVQELSAAGIDIRASRGCFDWERGCTSFVGSAAPAIVQYVKQFQASCRANNPACRVIITGATEPGHQSHARDKAIVDLGATTPISNYIYSRIGTNNPTAYRWYKDKTADIYYFWETDPIHWHICFSNVYCSQAAR